MNRDHIYSHLKNFSVGIAGAGGLGSNCAIALTRTGIGKLVIADFDCVNWSNLNRQYYFNDQIGIKKVIALRKNILRISSSTVVEIHDIKLDPESIKNIFSKCDIIVEAFDDAGMKEMLAETVLTKLPEIPLIMGSGMAGWGKTNILRERKIGDNLIVCGDEESEVSVDNPPLAARVAIVANMQANAVVELLMKRHEDITE